MINEKFIINISREFGSGGLSVAQQLAKRLGINFYDKNLIEIAARKSGLHKDYFEKHEENTQVGVLGDLSGINGNIFSAGYYVGNSIFNESLFKIQSDIIRQLARKESCIFVGRCADYVLRNSPRCLNIFICADKEDRIKRILDKRGNSQDIKTIEKEIEKTDKSRAKYYNFYTDKEWGKAVSYHLCINSSVLGIDATAEYIQSFAEKKFS